MLWEDQTDKVSKPADFPELYLDKKEYFEGVFMKNSVQA